MKDQTQITLIGVLCGLVATGCAVLSAFMIVGAEADRKLPAGWAKPDHEDFIADKERAAWVSAVVGFLFAAGSAACLAPASRPLTIRIVCLPLCAGMACMTYWRLFEPGPGDQRSGRMSALLGAGALVFGYGLIFGRFPIMSGNADKAPAGDAAGGDDKKPTGGPV